MFESAELGLTLTASEYERELALLRPALLKAQFEAREKKIPVIIMISGADGAGKGELVHRLNEWLDPRGVDTHAFWGSSDEERERPRYWRFWKALPARGRIGILFGSWYSEPIVQCVYGKLKKSELDQELDRIAFFEQMLAEDGALIVKLWFHLSRKAQRRRLKDLEADPRTHWRVLPQDWKHLKLYDEFRVVSERAIRNTDAGHAPWQLVDASDRRHREVATGQIILAAIRGRLAGGVPVKVAGPAALVEAPVRKGKAERTILDAVDLSQRLSERDYDKALRKWQGRLTRLMWKARERGISSVMVFEGWDAAGKGSAIRRVVSAMDPRLYHLIPIAAPSDEERAQHYLWRFWRHLPRAGRCTIYDRSWYGRVLVERVEGFATQAEWMRAYLEINEFEEQLAQHRVVVSKFWIHISKQEQLRRFREREKIAFKRHKITDEDWRNREKWDLYKAAVNEMVDHCSTDCAPWTLVAGNDKKFARIQILKTLCGRLDEAL